MTLILLSPDHDRKNSHQLSHSVLSFIFRGEASTTRISTASVVPLRKIIFEFERMAWMGGEMVGFFGGTVRHTYSDWMMSSHLAVVQQQQ